MPIAMPVPLPPAIVTRDELHSQWHGDVSWTSSLLYRDSLLQLVGNFKVGDCKYHPIAPLHGSYEPPMNGHRGRFLVAGLEDCVVGYGATLFEARRDWELGVDALIQNLLATLDFERTGEQAKLWSKLFEYFDLNEIRYANPLRIRAFGQLIGVRGHKYRIQWIDGSRNIVERKNIPAELVRFNVGQPFDAVVSRDARTWKLIRIDSVFAAKSLPNVSIDEARELLAPQKSETERKSLDWN